MAKLIIITGPHRGEEFSLGDTAVIGRLRRNDIPLKDDRGASRQHARVHRRGDQYFVVDLNSQNGTLVNGSPVQRAELHPGDELTIGGTRLRFDLEPAPRTPAPKTAPAAGSAGISALEDVVRLRDAPGSISTRALQYSPHASRGRRRGSAASFSWFRADLGQTTGLFRFLVLAAVLLLASAVGYLVFRLASG